RQPARLAQFDDGDDRAILVQGDEGSAQVIRLGHRGTPSVTCSDEVAIPRRLPHTISPLERNGFEIPVPGFRSSIFCTAPACSQKNRARLAGPRVGALWRLGHPAWVSRRERTLQPFKSARSAQRLISS